MLRGRSRGGAVTFELEGEEVRVEVPWEGGEGGGEAGAEGGEPLPPVVGHPLAVHEPLLQAGEGDVDREAADLRRVAHGRRRRLVSTTAGAGREGGETDLRAWVPEFRARFLSSQVARSGPRPFSFF